MARWPTPGSGACRGSGPRDLRADRDPPRRNPPPATVPPARRLDLASPCRAGSQVGGDRAVGGGGCGSARRLLVALRCLRRLRLQPAVLARSCPGSQDLQIAIPGSSVICRHFRQQGGCAAFVEAGRCTPRGLARCARTTGATPTRETRSGGAVRPATAPLTGATDLRAPAAQGSSSVVRPTGASSLARWAASARSRRMVTRHARMIDRL